LSEKFILLRFFFSNYRNKSAQIIGKKTTKKLYHIVLLYKLCW